MNPLDVTCGACLAPPGISCYSVSSDQIRAEPHRLREAASARELKRCEECNGLGWVPIDTLPYEDCCEDCHWLVGYCKVCEKDLPPDDE